ncbi:MAG: hypothetical protein WB586_00075 [Chthoniobacterales bacterium]
MAQCQLPAGAVHRVRKSSVTRLRELAESRRRAALVCFLWQSYRDAVDQMVDMFDKLLTRAHTQAQNELDEQLCRQRQTIQVSCNQPYASLQALEAVSERSAVALLANARNA